MSELDLDATSDSQSSVDSTDSTTSESQLNAARRVIREIARGEVSGFDLQQIAIRYLADSVRLTQ